MLRVLGFTFRTIIKLKIILASLLAGMAVAYGLQAREQSRSWGLSPGDAERPLAGDDLVAAPDHVTLAASSSRRRRRACGPGSRAWRTPGRAGTATACSTARGAPWAPRWVGRATGRRCVTSPSGTWCPLQPGGGFVARVVEPGQALVLYLDDEIVREQVRAIGEAGSEGAARAATEMEDMPAFGASWAFILEPEPGDRTRLIQRFRVDMELAAGQRRLLPLMGLGAFTLMRSQMLGLKRRAEQGPPPAA